ncbi:xylose operon transcription regulator XylR [Coraliomargarita akajimensis]|uniref:Transcriptional regulator, AraC family n=1 Tax=Coraliomargarita akajimensis (strain DSM 45221 / IAM 15411 / JCM 23193 / KCTC 12865 / 04OKA010-24) TaxID=583355 RepID=D5EN45_CORAD|nr:xylose operon transcription regulator XylR [Coraliomargarita akajimensis]ADE53480.1 transcriptional regulator, AraC family [Coraliomargarita akajimensis DSM 45221]
MDESKRAKNVLLLISGLKTSTHQGIARAAKEFGWYLNLSFIEQALAPENWHGDGILCALSSHPTIEQLVLRATQPVVDIAMQRSEVHLPRVVADNEQIGREAAAHLLQQNHQHFAWFCFNSDPVAQARLAGFEDAIGKAALSLVPRRSNYRTAVLQKLHALPRPCGIFAKTDADAAWILNLCIEEGFRIPDDFAIIGVDNNPLICDFLPVPLSSVNHDLEQLGYQAACLLEALMNGDAAPSETTLVKPTGVTVRGSTNSFAVVDNTVRQALVFMKDNLSKTIGATEIAEALSVSKRTLELRMRKVLDQTVHEKLMELRLNHAEQLLRHTTQTAEHIAALSGFCHAQHLSRAFKARFGEPPLRYRKQVQTDT